MDRTEIRDLVRRLARPYGEGRVIVEGTAIRAEGSDFDAVEAWILDQGGEQEVLVRREPPGGLHGRHFSDSQVSRNLETPRYVMPVAALELPPSEGDAG